MALYLFEHLESEDVTTLSCGAMRTGVPSAHPRILAAAWSRATDAKRLLRRVDEAEAGALFRLLIEFGGAPCPLTDTMPDELRRLSGWAPIAHDTTTVTLPIDVSLALAGAARFERGAVATLVGRLTAEDLDALAHELGVPTHGTIVSLRRRVARAILRTADDAIDRGAAAELSRIGHLDNGEVDGVRPVPDRRGTAFDIETAGGTFRIAPREHAVRLGLPFDPPEFSPQTRRTAEPERRLPTVLPIGAFVTFSTTRAADDALKEPGFRDLVLHRVDERRIATRSDVSAAVARACLTRLGFEMSSLAEGVRRARG